MGRSAGRCRRGRPCRSAGPRGGPPPGPGRPGPRQAAWSGSTSSMACIRPLPRTSPTARAALGQAPQPGPEAGPDHPGVALEVVGGQEVQHGQGTAGHQRVAAEVEIELAVIESISSARATTPPIGRPLPSPLAKVMASGRSHAASSPRSGRRCGPSRSGPRRPRTGSRGNSRTSFMAPNSPSGRHREPSHPLDGLGDHAGHLAGGGGVDHVARVVPHPGRDVPLVGQIARTGCGSGSRRGRS